MDGDTPSHMDFPVILLQEGSVGVPEEQELRTIIPKGGEVLSVLIFNLFFLFSQRIGGNKDNRDFEKRAKLCITYN